MDRASHTLPGIKHMPFLFFPIPVDQYQTVFLQLVESLANLADDVGLEPASTNSFTNYNSFVHRVQRMAKGRLSISAFVITTKTSDKGMEEVKVVSGRVTIND